MLISLTTAGANALIGVDFDNALFSPNTNDLRWASFDYAFDASELAHLPEQSSSTFSGLYELELYATDHRRSGIEEIHAHSEPDHILHRDPIDVGLGGASSLQFKSELADGMLLGMQRIFFEPENTSTSNEAQLLTTKTTGLDNQSEDGSWSLTPARKPFHHRSGGPCRSK